MFNNDDFDNNFMKTQKTIKTMFVFTAIAAIVGAVVSIGFVGAIIYFIVKETNPEKAIDDNIEANRLYSESMMKAHMSIKAFGESTALYCALANEQ